MTAEEKERSDAAWATVLANMGLVGHCVKPSLRPGLDPDDLRQGGLIGFYLVAPRADRSLGRVSTYYAMGIRDGVRKAASSGRVVWVPEFARRMAAGVARGDVDPDALSDEDRATLALAHAAMRPCLGDSDEDGRLVLASVPASPEPSSEDVEDLEWAISTLGERDRALIRMRFFEGKSLAEMARETRSGKRDVTRRLGLAVGALRERMAS